MPIGSSLGQLKLRRRGNYVGLGFNLTSYCGVSVSELIILLVKGVCGDWYIESEVVSIHGCPRIRISATVTVQ